MTKFLCCSTWEKQQQCEMLKVCHFPPSHWRTLFYHSYPFNRPPVNPHTYVFYIWSKTFSESVHTDVFHINVNTDVRLCAWSFRHMYVYVCIYLSIYLSLPPCGETSNCGNVKWPFRVAVTVQKRELVLIKNECANSLTLHSSAFFPQTDPTLWSKSEYNSKQPQNLIQCHT